MWVSVTSVWELLWEPIFPMLQPSGNVLRRKRLCTTTNEKMGKLLAVVVVGNCMLDGCWSARHLSNGGPPVLVHCTAVVDRPTQPYLHLDFYLLSTDKYKRHSRAIYLSNSVLMAADFLSLLSPFKEWRKTKPFSNIEGKLSPFHRVKEKIRSSPLSLHPSQYTQSGGGSLGHTWYLSFFSCPEQLNRWPCHWLTNSLTFTFDIKRASLVVVKLSVGIIAN